MAFYTIQTSTIEDEVKIPTIEIAIGKDIGYAYIDTAVRASIASTRLYKMLVEKGEKFEKRLTEVRLADGSVKKQTLLKATAGVTIGLRIVPINFTALPEAKDNRTLLGIDFLESAGITLNIPQRVWSFIDHPDEVFSFVQLRSERIPILKAARKIIYLRKQKTITISMTYCSGVDSCRCFPLCKQRYHQ